MRSPSEPAAEPDRVGDIVIPGIVAYAGGLRDRLWLAATADEARRAAEADELGEEIAGYVARIDSSARANGIDLGLVADPTRRALAWLTWLAEPGQRAEHLEALATATRRGRALRGDARRPAKTRDWDLVVDLYHIAGLVRGRGSAGAIRMTIAQVFVGAPDEVLDALLLAGAGARDRSHIALAREHALSDDARELEMALELSVAPPPPRTRGRCHDLEASFRRVNAALFGGRLSPPRIAWSRTKNASSLGCYHPQRDLVVINLALDDRRFRAQDVDFVVYHELLHRELGAEHAGGRRLHHGPAFRAAERRYPGYGEVARRLGLRRG